jgi:hypothetical protein
MFWLDELRGWYGKTIGEGGALKLSVLRASVCSIGALVGREYCAKYNPEKGVLPR